MKHIQLFEKFSKEKYSKIKNELENKLIQDLGDKFIIDIVAEGDFDSLKYLEDTGYNFVEFGDENLLVVALMNNKMKMFDYLLKEYDKVNSNWDVINSIRLKNLLGEDEIKGVDVNINKTIEWLKIITKYGYNWNDNYNYIELYLCEDVPDGVDKNGQGKYKKILKDGLEPFIEWLIDNYPENYKIAKNCLPERLLKKYKHLDNADKYNL
jgi:hypothetical protein